MNETRIYNNVMLAGIGILLGGVFFHSWVAVAAGAMIGGVGGVFGIVASRKE
jgi:hypothetical protein